MRSGRNRLMNRFNDLAQGSLSTSAPRHPTQCRLEGFGFAAFLGAVVVGLLGIRVGLCDIGLAGCSYLHGAVSCALWG